jgi:hypothetical protein
VDMSLEPGQRPQWNTPQYGKRRLIMPRVQSGGSPLPIDLGDANGGGSEGDGDGTADPLIQGLVDRLPKLDSTWSLDDRAKWLRTAASIFWSLLQGW